jgi:hypothetical protein
MNDLVTAMQDAGRLQIIPVTMPVAAPTTPAVAAPDTPSFPVSDAAIDANLHRRRIEASWPLDGQVRGERGRYVVLTAYHFADRKRFSASVNVHRHEHNTTTCMPFDAVTLEGQPVARYSPKAFQAYFDALLASPQLQDAIAEAIERNNEPQSL